MTSIGIDHVCTPRTGSVYDLTEFWKLGILFFLRATVDSRCQNGSHPFCLEFSLIFFMTGWAIALLETEKIKHFFLSLSSRARSITFCAGQVSFSCWKNLGLRNTKLFNILWKEPIINDVSLRCCCRCYCYYCRGKFELIFLWSAGNRPEQFHALSRFSFLVWLHNYQW